MLPILILADVAAGPTSVQLWRGLMLGEEVESVATKIGGVEGVTKAKPKRRSHDGQDDEVAISYAGEGISILGHEYAIAPVFKGHHLVQVGLGSLKQCANDAWQRYSALSATLAEKYPRHIDIDTALNEYEFSRTVSRGTEENPSSVNRFYSDGSVVVMLRLSFATESLNYLGSYNSGAVNALGNLMIDQYRQRGDECDHTGHRRMSVIISYMSLPDFTAKAKEASDSLEKDAAAAKAAL